MILQGVATEEEEDLVDPQDELKEKCSENRHCSRLREILNECNDRVESRSSTAETCTPELFDFVHCVDLCVSNSTSNSFENTHRYPRICFRNSSD